MRSRMFANRFSFVAAGFTIAAWAPIIPFIQERFSLNEHQLGIVLLCVGAGSVLSSPAGGYLSTHLGCRLPIISAVTLWALCFAGVAFSHNLFLTYALLFVFGASAVTVEVVSNINGTALEKLAGNSIMSGLHAMYSTGSISGSAGVSLLLSAGLPPELCAAGAALIIWSTVFFSRHRLLNRKQLTLITSRNAPNAGLKENTVWLNPAVILTGLVLFTLYLNEGVQLDWIGVYLVQDKNFAIQYAGFGFTVFASAMLICRLAGDFFVRKFSRRFVILSGVVMTAAGYACIVLSQNPLSVMLSLILTGTGSANTIPQLVSFAAEIKDVPMHKSVTAVNTIGFTGVMAGPALIGFFAGLFGLGNAMYLMCGLMIPVFIVCFKLLSASAQSKS